MSASVGSQGEGSSRKVLGKAIEDLASHREMVRAFQLLEEQKAVSLEGVWPATVAPMAASVGLKRQEPLIVVLGHVNDAETVHEEITQLTDRPVVYFPIINSI